MTAGPSGSRAAPRGGVRAALAIGALGCCFAAAHTPEQELWKQVIAVREATTPDAPYATWLTREEGRRQTLLARVRLYQSLYPGADHRDEALRLELQTLFELLAGSGAGLGALCERAAEVRRAAPSPAAIHEAAYWELLCRVPADGSGSEPAARTLSGGISDIITVRPDPAYLRAARAYVAEYPASRYAPRLAAVLFAAAEPRGDVAELDALVADLRSHHALDPITSTLEAKLRRLRAIGEPFRPELRLTTGVPLAWGEFAGRPVLLLVWAAFDRPARELAARLAERRDAGRPVLVGLSLDAGAAEADAAARELGLELVVCDGRGWGGDFVRAWGIDRIPFLFEIDASGVLMRAGAAVADPGPANATVAPGTAR